MYIYPFSIYKDLGKNLKLATVNALDSWSCMLMSIRFFSLSKVTCVSGGGQGGSILCYYSQCTENRNENWSEYTHKNLSVCYVYEMK